MPKISVIIPIYNVEKYLKKCLDSIINQTFKDIEIICVNDGSTDNSPQILEEYAAKDNRIKIVNKQNGGLASARNAGIDAAIGEFISFIDSDDWIDANTYECLNQHLDDVDIVCFGTYLEGSCKYANHRNDLEYYNVKFEGKHNLTNNIRLQTDVSAWNKLYKLNIIKENNLFFDNGKHYEDYGFFWKYSLICKKGYFVKDKFYHYLRRDDSIMAKTFKRESDKVIDHLIMSEIIFDYMKEKGIFEENKEVCAKIFFNCLDFVMNFSKFENIQAAYEYASKIANKYNLDDKYKKIRAIKRGDFKNANDPELTFLQKLFSIKKVQLPLEQTYRKNLCILGIVIKLKAKRR